jgi:hypothetical protein
MHRRLAPVGATLLALALVPAARAGTLTMEGTTAVFTAGAGEVNTLEGQLDDYGSVQLTDRNPIRAQGIANCTGANTQIDCALNATGLRIELGDQDDTANITAPDATPVTISGGDGDDELTASGTPVKLLGDAGDDLLDATGKNASYAGGDGSDLIMNREKASVDCTGGGLDRAFKPASLTRVACPAVPRVAPKLEKRQTIDSFLTVGLRFSADCSRPCAVAWALRPDQATRRLMHYGGAFLVSAGVPLDEAGYPDLVAGTHPVRAIVPGPATRRALKKAKRIGMTLELSGTDGLALLRPVRVKITLR